MVYEAFKSDLMCWGFFKSFTRKDIVGGIYQCYDVKTTKYGFTSEPQITQVYLETIIRKYLAVLNNRENKHSSFSRNCIMLASFFSFVPLII